MRYSSRILGVATRPKVEPERTAGPRLRSVDRMAVGPEGWDITVEDVMSGVDELIRRGIVDPDRMALYGLATEELLLITWL